MLRGSLSVDEATNAQPIIFRLILQRYNIDLCIGICVQMRCANASKGTACSLLAWFPGATLLCPRAPGQQASWIGV
jgi:hypothetical protein